MSLQLGFFLIALSVVLNAFFAGVETGFTSARVVRLLHRARRGNRGAALAERLLRRKENTIVAAVVGNNVAVVGGTAVATYTFVAWLGDPGETVAAVVMSILNIVLGEILPKTLYRAHPERLVSLSSHVFLGLSWALAPLQWVALGLARGILWLLRARSPRDHAPYSRRTLLQTFALSHEQEELDSHQDTLLQQFVENSRHEVSRFMTPYDRVASVGPEATTAEVIDVVRRTGHSRIVVRGPDGELDALVLFRDLVHHAPEDPLGPALRDVVRVSQRLGIDEAIGVLNDARVSLAVVVDPLGRSRGIVTLEDLLEPLVGEILDEHDLPRKAGEARGTAV